MTTFVSLADPMAADQLARRRGAAEVGDEAADVALVERELDGEVRGSFLAPRRPHHLAPRAVLEAVAI